MRPQRAAAPLSFIIAVVGAVAVFVIFMTQGLTMALAFAIMATALIWSFSSEQGGVYSLILAALAEGIYKSLAPTMLTMLVKDIILVIMLLRLFWVSQREKNFIWLRQPFTAAAVCFTAYCVALMFAPSTRSMLLAIAGLRAWLLWMPAYFPFYAYFSEPGRIIRFTTVLTFIMLPVSIYGIVQGNIGYDHMRVLPHFYRISQFYQSDFDPNAENPQDESGSAGFESTFKPIMNVRACSIHISPGAFGAMCAVLILLSIGFVAYTSSSNLRLWGIIAALAAAGGLLASGSRAPMMGLVGGFIAMILVARRRGALVGMLLLVAAVSVFFLRDITGGGAIRLENRLSWDLVIERAMFPLQVGFQQGLAHPFGNGIATGIGMGRMFYGAGLRTAEGVRWVENEFGRALGELGFFGSAVWLFMIVGILWHCARAIRRMGTTPEGMLAAGMFGAMVTVFVQLSVGSALYGAHGGMYYWILGAAILRLGDHVVARQRAEQDQQPQAEQPPEQPAAGPPPFQWRQPGRLRRPARPAALRPPQPPKGRPPGLMPPLKPPAPGPYRRAPGAPPGPRPGEPVEPPAEDKPA